jgi:putative thioredoxin
MIHVTIENFDTEVVAASTQLPVLVDFWAPWCGPCKVLGPLLERIETEYAGRFKLVEIDSDQQQELSQAFGIRSLPTCVLMMNGKPVDGFMGAQSEAQLKAFLDKHVPSTEVLEAQSDAQDAQALIAAGDPKAALHKLHEALSINPGNDDARYDYVKLLMEHDLLQDAHEALAPALAEIPRQLRFEALKQFLDAINFIAENPMDSAAIEQLDQRIAANKRDFEARLAKARVLMVDGNWTGSMDELLEIIMRDKAWGEAVPRKTYVAILELLTPPKPKPNPLATGKTAGGIEIAGKALTALDPQAQLVATYRRKLSMALN